MLVVIQGAGDIATGIALRLYRAGLQVVMTDLPFPTAIRRTVCFSEAIPNGSVAVENVVGRRVAVEEVPATLAAGEIPILVDPQCAAISSVKADAVVDAILAKQNLGTDMNMAPVVVAVGPGFTAGVDCHAVVETCRGHYLGRVIYDGPAAPNTGAPGNIGGYTVERIIRAPRSGLFTPICSIGDQVEAGQTVGRVDGEPVIAQITGTLRGILPENTPVHAGMKSGDVDPRCKPEHCTCASDKALAVGGGVLEALLHFWTEKNLLKL